jgi:uncharacterized membrane protein
MKPQTKEDIINITLFISVIVITAVFVIIGVDYMQDNVPIEILKECQSNNWINVTDKDNIAFGTDCQGYKNICEGIK